MQLPISSEGPKTSLELSDSVLPEINHLAVTKSPSDNVYLAVFAVSDNESGVRAAYLRVKKWLNWDEWREAANPVQLALGVWAFQLKVVDNNGNAVFKTAYVIDGIIQKVFYLILAIIFLFWAYYFIIRSNKKLL